MDTNVLQNRRRDIATELERLQHAIDAYNVELAEIEAAERVIARYYGANGAEASTPIGASAPPAASKGSDQPSVTKMIIKVLNSAFRSGKKGLEPAEIFAAIVERGWTANRDTVRSRAWAMWHEGKLVKQEGSAVYSLWEVSLVGDDAALPPYEKPADEVSGQDASAGLSDEPPAQGREAGPGGGT